MNRAVAKKEADIVALSPQLSLHQCRCLVDFFSQSAKQLLVELRRSLDAGEFAESDRLFDEIKERLGIRADLEMISASLSTPSSSETPTFLISSTVLHLAFEQLAKIKTESILYASGSRYGNILTVERLIPLKLVSSEFGYAAADLNDSTKVLCELDKTGSVMTAYFHMHPGKGAGSNHPSSIDIDNQTRMELGGFQTIGGIFSRDGFVRFFADKLNYRIHITGKGIKHVGSDLYQITQDQNL